MSGEREKILKGEERLDTGYNINLELQTCMVYLVTRNQYPVSLNNTPTSNKTIGKV